MIDLTQELAKKGEARSQAIEKFGSITEVKQLMQAAEGREREVLKAFHLDDNIVKVENLRGQVMESEKFKEEFGNSVARVDIGKLAIKYHMRFLSLSQFKGAIDPILAAKMLAFGDKHGIDVTKDTDNFYVLAPAGDFNLETEKHRKPRPVVSQDPILFYKADRVGEFWTIVHKWGTEFNFLRLINSLRFRDENFYVWHYTLVFFAIYMLAFTGLFGGFTWNMAVITAICGVLAFASGLVCCGVLSDSSRKNKFSDKNWTDSRFHVDVAWDE